MRDNAVIIKELRSRMRGGRAFVTITIYLLFLSLVAVVVLGLGTAMNSMGAGAGSFYIGIALFTTISFFQLAMASFLTLSFTTGAITREKEQQTYDLLVTTKMSPLAIVGGKLASSISYMLLLILASIPLTSITFILGGISVLDFILVHLLILVTVVFFGSIGLFFSALLSKTQFSTILSYTTALILIVGTPILAAFIGALLLSGPNQHPVVAKMLSQAILVFNPFYALVTIFSGTVLGGPASVPMPIGGPGGPAQANPLIPDWLYTLIIYSISTCFLLFMASKFIKPVNRWDFTPLGRSAKLSAPSSSDMIE